MEGDLKEADFRCAMVVIYGFHSRREHYILLQDLGDLKSSLY